MIWEMYPAQEIYSGCESAEGNLIRMEIEMKVLLEKIADPREKLFEATFVSMKEREIVGITDIMFCFERMFHELVELIHVDIRKKLGGEIAEREAG
jgi:hypothetical protein